MPTIGLGAIRIVPPVASCLATIFKGDNSTNATAYPDSLAVGAAVSFPATISTGTTYWLPEGGYYVSLSVQGNETAADAGTKRLVNVTAGNTVVVEAQLGPDDAERLMKGVANLTVSAFSTTGVSSFAGLIKSTLSTAVTVAMGAAAGTTPPAAVATSSNACRGKVTFGTGTTAGTGTLLTLTHTSYTTVPYTQITPANAATAALGLYVVSETATTCVVGCQNAPADSQPNTTYAFNFLTMG